MYYEEWDVMRKTPLKSLVDGDQKLVSETKDMGLEFHKFISSLGTSRELSLAKTKIEEAVMWAVKHITR